MEENLASTSSSQPLSPPPSFESTKLKHQNPSTESSISSPLPPSVTRLWRPAAQRNLRNQWYMNAMELGVLSDMPDIRKKACWKLFKQQKLYRSKLLSSYKDMVDVVMHMVKTSRSMRTFLKGSSSLLVQFSSNSEDKNDQGDGRGIPVYAFWSISYFGKRQYQYATLIFPLLHVPDHLSQFACIPSTHILDIDMNEQRLLVVELLSISSEEVPVNGVCWLDELYPGEFDDLCICGLYSTEVCEPVRPKINDWKSDTSSDQSNRQPDHDILQVAGRTISTRDFLGSMGAPDTLVHPSDSNRPSSICMDDVGSRYLGTGSLGPRLVVRATDPAGLMTLSDAAAVRLLRLLHKLPSQFRLALRVGGLILWSCPRMVSILPLGPTSSVCYQPGYVPFRPTGSEVNVALARIVPVFGNVYTELWRKGPSSLLHSDSSMEAPALARKVQDDKIGNLQWVITGGILEDPNTTHCWTMKDWEAKMDKIHQLFSRTPHYNSNNGKQTILQLGRVGKAKSVMDYRYPLTGFQAFCICLASIDSKLCCAL
ncbi:hypothetical protein Acr_03g0014520 [Actinidia rufa]|uniref:Tubby C-terminal domain-containing protein n=1 Tax=Actinidia rufa TaxID=165716 RepID=A0A7J0EDW4_9ERIC|nr:hypothetical protein Acr_03g0014520 [Actinidia rufa]